MDDVDKSKQKDTTLAEKYRKLPSIPMG